MVYGAIFFLLALFGALGVLVRTIGEHAEDILAALEGPKPLPTPPSVVIRPRQEPVVQRFAPQCAAA